MPLLLFLAALLVALPALGQPSSTNLTFFQRFVSGEIPFRELVWRTRFLPPPTNGPPGGWSVLRAGWVSNSAFTELIPSTEDADEEGMFRGASRSQYWCVRPSGIQAVDRDKTASSFLGVASDPFVNGKSGVYTAMMIRSLGLPLIEPGSVRWQPDGSFNAVTMLIDMPGYRVEPSPVSGRIVRQGDAGPVEIEFRVGTEAKLKRVEYTYGTNLGVAMPERIVKFEGTNHAIPTGEIIIGRVSLDVSSLSSDGFTPGMFARSGWSTRLVTWTNSTQYISGMRGPTYYNPTVARAIIRLRGVLQRLGIRTKLDTLNLGPVSVR